MDDLLALDITGASAALRQRTVSAEELTRFYLKRIARLDSDCGAYFTVTADYALAKARACDADVARGLSRGPLHGVPVALKDMLDTRFAPTSAGLAFLGERNSAANACAVDRLEAAGAVVLGKLAMTEGAYMAHHPSRATPRNPWSAAHWPGVSSSGSGVAVAAGLCLGALGSDTGGSIRLPSAACGTTGLKPTFGRVSRAGAFPLSSSLDHVGPMARSAADAAVLLQAIAGADPADPSTVAAPSPADYLKVLNQGVSGLRIGVDETLLMGRAAPVVADAIGAMLDVLTRCGAEIVAVAFPDSRGAMEAFGALIAHGAAQAHAAPFAAHGHAYGDALRDLIRYGSTVTPAALQRAEQQRAEWRRALAGSLQRVDMLALPAFPIEIPSLAAIVDLAKNPESGLADFTIPFNICGSPTITFPVGRDSAGLPLSAQLVGAAFAEGALLRAAYAFQQASDWHRPACLA